MRKDAYFRCLVKRLLAFFRPRRGNTKASGGHNCLPTALVFFFMICFRVWLGAELCFSV